MRRVELSPEILTDFWAAGESGMRSVSGKREQKFTEADRGPSSSFSLHQFTIAN